MHNTRAEMPELAGRPIHDYLVGFDLVTRGVHYPHACKETG
jgi:hypothetical protein